MSDKKINQKTSALLALEAKMIEKDQEVYNLEAYIPDMFTQIEEVLAAEKPERLLDQTELKTFQTLLENHSCYTLESTSMQSNLPSHSATRLETSSSNGKSRQNPNGAWNFSQNSKKRQAPTAIWLSSKFADSTIGC